jgi:hypothetical protein
MKRKAREEQARRAAKKNYKPGPGVVATIPNAPNPSGKSRMFRTDPKTLAAMVALAVRRRKRNGGSDVG